MTKEGKPSLPHKYEKGFSYHKNGSRKVQVCMVEGVGKKEAVAVFLFVFPSLSLAFFLPLPWPVYSPPPIPKAASPPAPEEPEGTGKEAAATVHG